MRCTGKAESPPMKDNNDFASRLVKARKKRDLNQTELANLSGLQPSAIGHFEKNRRKPSLDNFRYLAKALKVSSDYLLGQTDTMEGATTIFSGEENLSNDNREHIQVIIDLINNEQFSLAEFRSTNPTADDMRLWNENENNEQISKAEFHATKPETRVRFLWNAN